MQAGYGYRSEPRPPGNLVGLTARCRFGALLATAFLTGCTTGQDRPTLTTNLPAVPPTVVVASADLVGSWGLASYRNEADRPRTEVEAKSACSNPYRIDAGVNGGVMMYLADQAQASEVFVKASPNGQVFIGPQGPPGVAQDRLVVAYDNNSVLVTDWLDASARERYGTMIFVRCGVA